MDRLHGFVEWLGRWRRTVFAVLGAILAFGAGFWGFLGENNPTLRGWLFVIGLAGTILAVLMPVSEARASHRRITELETALEDAGTNASQAVEDAKRSGREAFLLVLDFAIRPLLEKLGPLVRSRRAATKINLATELKVLGLSALKELIGPTTLLRANYYKLEYAEDGRGPRLLNPVSTAMVPRESFDLGDGLEESEAILTMLRDATYVFTDDWKENPPRGFDTEVERPYRAFISAAASDGMDVDGMISVDSPEPGSLTEVDASLVQLVATIIAISEAVRDGKKNDAEA